MNAANPTTSSDYGIDPIPWDTVPFDNKIDCCWYDSGGVYIGRAWRSPEGRHRKAHGYMAEHEGVYGKWDIYQARHMVSLAGLLYQGKLK